eukprot:SAG31_NODE_1152_length_9642_cov_4.124489_2_plen_103_part_00
MVSYVGDPGLAIRMWTILHRMHDEYVDEAAIFPTHLSSGLIRSHADRALCTMLCPAPTGPFLHKRRETGRGLGLAGLALERLRYKSAETVAARWVLQNIHPS